MVATTALSQKFFDLYPRIPERLELFPGLLNRVTILCPNLAEVTDLVTKHILGSDVPTSLS